MKATTLFLSLALLIFSCNNEGTDCENTICTTDFRVVSVKIVDQSGASVELTRSEVADADGNVFIRDMSDVDRTELFYLIASDGNQGDLKLGENTVTFRGWIDDELVVEQEYVIGLDCCHISKVSGPEEISID